MKIAQIHSNLGTNHDLATSVVDGLFCVEHGGISYLCMSIVVLGKPGNPNWGTF